MAFILLEEASFLLAKNVPKIFRCPKNVNLHLSPIVTAEGGVARNGVVK